MRRSKRGLKIGLLTAVGLGGLGATWVASSQTDGWFDAKTEHHSGSTTTRQPIAANESYQRLIVKFKSQTATRTDADAARQLVQALNAPGGVQLMGQKAVSLAYLKSVSEQIHVVQVDQALSRSEAQALAKQLTQQAEVEYVEVDEKVYPHMTPNDPNYSANQWAWQSWGINMGATNAEGTWSKVTAGAQPVNGSGVVVAVLDSGYRPHADLAANLVTGYDFVSADTLPYSPFSTANDGGGRDTDATDPGDWNTDSRNGCEVGDGKSSWHGTRVAGIIGAIGNNSVGMIGMAYGAKILPVRVLGVCGGYTSDIVAGMRWAAGLSVGGAPANANPAKVLNLSLGGGSTCSTTFQDAVNDVRAVGSVVVASTGNEGTTTSITQPASCKGVIAVTAHMLNGNSPTFANIGPGTTISAPGVSIYGTSNTGTTIPVADNYATGNGTSFAAPMVSGVAALLLQIKPGMGIDELTSRLVDSVRAFPTGTYCVGKTTCGAGMLDADVATTLVLADTAPTTSASASSTDPVARGMLVTLTGTATAGATGGSTINSVGWTQLSGPTVTLTGANTNTATFTTPATSDSTGITFRFQATASNTLTSSSRVSIGMVSAPNPVSSSGGGGGGAFDWLELSTLLIMAVATLPPGRRMQVRHKNQQP
jgi:serine protease